jgi:hypothetical protein
MYNTSDVLPEFSAQEVTLQVLDRLERRRAQVVEDPALVDAEVTETLATVEKSYHEAELPLGYFESLKSEVRAIVPAEWQKVARPFTQREAAEFRLWRGGDVVARLTYVFLALMIGGFIVWAPFIPFWEKWFPFALSASAWWLPDAQVAWHKRRYARRLGEIARRMGELQPRLDGMVTTEELLLPEKGAK